MEITDFGYMLLHEKGNKIYFVAYPEKGKFGCLVFVQRKGIGTRHLVLDLEPQFELATQAVAVAEFEIEIIQNKPKLYDIRD